MFHIWECREDEETARSADEEVIGIVIDWLHDEKRFEGTASELLEILHDALPCELRPNILSRWLNKHKGMLKANGVSYTLRRTRDSRTICLSCDGNDANDDISWIGAASKIPSPSSRVPFPVSWTVKMKKKQKETQDILSYHSQAAGCSDKARAKASGGRQPIEECGRTGL